MNSAELVTTQMSASLCSTLMFVGVFVFVCGDQKITVAYGRNITLTCRAANDNIDIVEWIRADLKGEYVLLYRDEHFNQHPSFKNRVDLKDRQMKDGDVSLILKNVTIDDAGKYECHVVQGGTNRRKRSNLDCDPISIIHLSVVDPPDQPGGSVGLIVGLSISAGILVAFVFLLYRKYKPQNRHFI